MVFKIGNNRYINKASIRQLELKHSNTELEITLIDKRTYTVNLRDEMEMYLRNGNELTMDNIRSFIINELLPSYTHFPNSVFINSDLLIDIYFEKEAVYYKMQGDKEHTKVLANEEYIKEVMTEGFDRFTYNLKHYNN